MSKRRTQRQYQRMDPSGINQDIPASELPPELYSNCNNIQFRDGSAQRSGGSKALLGTPLFPPYSLLFAQAPSVAYWLYAGATQIGVTDGTLHFDISPTPAPAPIDTNDWTSALLNNVAVWNDAVGAPTWWDGQTGNPTTALPDWFTGTTCRAIRPFKFNLVAMDLNRPAGHFENQLAWSASADPGAVPAEWTPTPTNDAGDAILSSTPGAIVDGLSLRDLFMIYKTHSTYAMAYIGGQFIMDVRKLFVTSGILSRNCVAESRGVHIVMTDGDVVRTDGQSVQSIVHQRMRRWIFGGIDSDNFERCFVVPDQSNDEVWICFPETGHNLPNLALVYNTNDDSHGVRELIPETSYIGRGIVADTSVVVTWDLDTTQWDSDLTRWNQAAFSATNDQLLACDPNGVQLIAMDADDQRMGADFEAFVGRDSLDLGDAESVKTVTAIWPRVTARQAAQLLIRVGGQMHVGDPIDWSGEQTYITGTSQKVDFARSGRLISVQFRSTDRDVWRLHSFDVEFRTKGKH